MTVKRISFVVPVYNEEENLHEFHKRLGKVMEALPYDYDLIFVDDGSSDSSHLILAELAEKDEHVQVYFLSRNYGHQLALTCGLDNACGDAVITMDGDLQHPPELVPELLKLWEDGFQIVQTVRTATEDASFFKNITSKAYYKIINSMSKVEITPGGSDFRLIRWALKWQLLNLPRRRVLPAIPNTICAKCCILLWTALLHFPICRCAGRFISALCSV